MANKRRINVSLDADLHRVYQRIADATGQSFSGMVEEMLRQALPQMLELEAFITRVKQSAGPGGQLQPGQAEGYLEELKDLTVRKAKKQLDSFEQLSLGDIVDDQEAAG